MKFEDDEIKKVFRENGDKPEPNDGIRRHPMRLKRGYVTADPAREKDPVTGYPLKMLAGEVHNLPIEEARRLMKLGAAEREDQFDL